MTTIAVDAMGGYFAPQAIVQGVAEVSLATDVQILLVGDEHQIQGLLDDVSYNPEHIDVVHAADAIGMEEEPRPALRRKRQASLSVTARLVAEGRAAAMVAGSHADAVLRACARQWATLPGIQQTAVASLYPRQTEYPGQDGWAMLLDVGAASACAALDLVRFAVMGSAYYRVLSQSAAPRVALLNVDRRGSRGGTILAEAQRRLQAVPQLNFVGNIEGHELLTGRADVIVCEGFVGNVVSKLIESLADMAGGLAAAAAQQNWRHKLGIARAPGGAGRLREGVDYGSYGGAPILGFEAICIRAHERSTPRAIANAVRVADRAVREKVGEQIRTAVREVH